MSSPRPISPTGCCRNSSFTRGRKTPSTIIIRMWSAITRRDGRSMRAFASLLAISAALAAARVEAAPRRGASLNLCTDELVLMLAAPEQVVSVTHLAQQEAETPLWRQAARYRRNDGSLLSVVALRPDLIVTMGGGGRDRLRIAERLGIPTIDLPFAQSLGDVVESIRRLAVALGRPEAATLLLRRMTALMRSAPTARRDAIWLG